MWFSAMLYNFYKVRLGRSAAWAGRFAELDQTFAAQLCGTYNVSYRIKPGCAAPCQATKTDSYIERFTEPHEKSDRSAVRHNRNLTFKLELKLSSNIKPSLLHSVPYNLGNVWLVTQHSSAV